MLSFTTHLAWPTTDRAVNKPRRNPARVASVEEFDSATGIEGTRRLPYLQTFMHKWKSDSYDPATNVSMSSSPAQPSASQRSRLLSHRWFAPLGRPAIAVKRMWMDASGGKRRREKERQQAQARAVSPSHWAKVFIDTEPHAPTPIPASTPTPAVPPGEVHDDAAVAAAAGEVVGAEAGTAHGPRPYREHSLAAQPFSIAPEDQPSQHLSQRRQQSPLVPRQHASPPSQQEKQDQHQPPSRQRQQPSQPSQQQKQRRQRQRAPPSDALQSLSSVCGKRRMGSGKRGAGRGADWWHEKVRAPPFLMAPI